jgi:hypothetical protein
MKDTIRREIIKHMRPVRAEGHIKLDLTDPVTGKVENRIEGKNTVFPSSIFSGSPWHSSVSQAYLCLNDNTDAIATTFPYLKGQTIGWGIPSTGSSGTRQGAYNAANQVLAELTTDSIRWVFQYDFTTAQCNDEAIGCMGLTHQYANLERTYAADYKTTNNAAVGSFACDGRYAYGCSTGGIVTKYDLWLGTSSTVDLSATVGTSVSEYKVVGCALATDKCYIWRYSSNTANRSMFVYSDNTFSTLENTHSVSNAVPPTITIYPMYIYGDVAYLGITNGYNKILYFDFIANSAFGEIAIPEYNNCMYAASSSAGSRRTGYGTCAYDSTRVYFASNGSGSMLGGVIFNLSTQAVEAHVYPLKTSANNGIHRHPLTDENIIAVADSAGGNHKAALCAYKLDTPVTKTSANGMTATYELEVFWDYA